MFKVLRTSNICFAITQNISIIFLKLLLFMRVHVSVEKEFPTVSHLYTKVDSYSFDQYWFNGINIHNS